MRIVKMHDKHGDWEQSYRRDVLRLENGTVEEQLDTELMSAAIELGVILDTPSHSQQGIVSKRSPSEQLPRMSQESIGSKASQSTCHTSFLSDTSRENHPRRSRVSLSFREYDAAVARSSSIPSGRLSHSLTPPSTPSGSVTSLPLSTSSSSPKRSFRRIRNLGMLRLHRVDSAIKLADSSCAHCSQGTTSARRATHKLPCGHKLCTQGLREVVKSATTQVASNALPSCCGMPVPSRMIEHVLTQTEQLALLSKLEIGDGRLPVLPMPNGGLMLSSTIPILEHDSVEKVEASTTPPVAPAATIHDAAWVIGQPDFVALRERQTSQRDRFLLWIEQQRSALEVQHAELKAQLALQQEVEVDVLFTQQSDSMSDAEDKQVKAEADLREAHDQEKRDNATALKYMESYCAGHYTGTGDPHGRVVTEQDFAELEKTRRLREQMDGKQESAINILRGEQGRRLRLRAQRHGREELEMQTRHKKETAKADGVCMREMREMGDLVETKRATLRSRWQLEMRIALKRLEMGTNLDLKASLPDLEWRFVHGGESSPKTVRPLDLRDAVVVKTGISTAIAMCSVTS